MKNLERNPNNFTAAIRLPEGIGERLLGYLSGQSSPCTKKQLLKSVPGRRKSKLAALRALILEGHINKIGSGKKGNPFFYSIANPDNHTDEEIII